MTKIFGGLPELPEPPEEPLAALLLPLESLLDESLFTAVNPHAETMNAQTATATSPVGPRGGVNLTDT